MLAFATEETSQVLERLRQTACYVDQQPWYHRSTGFIVCVASHQPLPRRVRAVCVDDGVFTDICGQATAYVLVPENYL